MAAFQLPNTRLTVCRDGWFSPAWSHSCVKGGRLCLRYQSVIAYTIVSGVQRKPVRGPVLMAHLLRWGRSTARVWHPDVRVRQSRRTRGEPARPDAGIASDA